MRVVTNSEEETVRLGRALASGLGSARTLLLRGELGSGKTALVRGIAQGLGVSADTPVTSPTFTLVNQYPTPKGFLYHLDLYRLNTLRDLYSIGIEDILASPDVVVVEWAEKLLLPVENPLRVEIASGAAPQQRMFEIEPSVNLGAWR